jgi:hypothetical protein
MKRSTVIGTLVALSVAVPTLAQAAEFWVVQDTATKKCMIVDKKPTVTTTTVIGGDGRVYKTRVEAESAMKTEKICVTK